MSPVQKIKDLPAWIKLAVSVGVVVATAVWAIAAIKSKGEVAVWQLQNHEKRITAHDGKLTDHERRIDSQEAILSAIQPTMTRIDMGQIELSKLMMQFIQENAELKGYLKGIEVIEVPKDGN